MHHLAYTFRVTVLLFGPAVLKLDLNPFHTHVHTFYNAVTANLTTGTGFCRSFGPAKIINRQTAPTE